MILGVRDSYFFLHANNKGVTGLLILAMIGSSIVSKQAAWSFTLSQTQKDWYSHDEVQLS